MKHFSRAILAMFLAVTVLSSCKKNDVEQSETTGSTKGGGSTSALRTIYVSGNWGSDESTNPFSSSTPYKTLQKAASITQAGDEVLVMNGTYTPSTTNTDSNTPVLKVTTSGTSSNYIVFKAYPGATPVIYSSGRRWVAVWINASYIKFEGIEVKGNNANLLLADAKAAEQNHRAGGGDYARYSEFNTTGITVGGQANSSTNPHHIEVRNNKVHHTPGGGIAVERADYVTVDGNTVYNTSWFTMYGTSGISVLAPSNYNTATGYKMWITRNKSYGNKTQVPYQASSTGSLSDGNGIIIDVNDGTLSTTNYTGKTLVENNISYLNGAGGVHVYKAKNVDVFNNTTYMNEQVLAYANINANQANNIRFRNNIAYAKSGGKANGLFNGSTGGNVTFDYNVYYNGSVTSGGANSQTANPLFVNPSAGDFWLNTGSPAINAGMSSSLSGTGSDIRWQTRLKNGRIDAGAYEVN